MCRTKLFSSLVEDSGSTLHFVSGFEYTLMIARDCDCSFLMRQQKLQIS